MMQATWEVIAYTFGYLPFYAAVHHPIETVAACLAFVGVAIWKA